MRIGPWLIQAHDVYTPGDGWEETAYYLVHDWHDHDSHPPVRVDQQHTLHPRMVESTISMGMQTTRATVGVEVRDAVTLLSPNSCHSRSSSTILAIATDELPSNCGFIVISSKVSVFSLWDCVPALQ